jgi:HPt (histidine-containing phosphotransfer) domain-containing protein
VAAGKEGHALKGAAANVHAQVLAIEGERLEKACAANDNRTAKEIFLRLSYLATVAGKEIPGLPFVGIVDEKEHTHN